MSIFRIFEGLSTKEIDSIFNLGRICPFKEGELIFRKGDISNEVYLILTGKVDIFDNLRGHIGAIAGLGPGEILGEAAFFGQSRTHSVHAIAREPSQILLIHTHLLPELLETEIPKRFLLNIIGLMHNRLHATNRMYMHARYRKSTPRIQDIGALPR